MTGRRYHLAAQELAAADAAALAAAESAGSGWTPPTPRPAAGVLLVRDAAGRSEVLLVRRRPDVGFAAGAFVFPGGTLDEDDSDPAWKKLLDEPAGEALAGAAGPDGAPERAFVVAALRELFEEAGVLLTAGDQPGPEQLSAARAELVSGRSDFHEIVSGLGARLAGDSLLLCARWITPEALSRRYDARFFLAESPPDIEVTPELGELVEHVWASPGEALERYVKYDFPMMFPTAVTLGWLEGGSSVSEWFEKFLAREIVPILPRLRRVDGEVMSILPDDPRYDDPATDG